MRIYYNVINRLHIRIAITQGLAYTRMMLIERCSFILLLTILVGTMLFTCASPNFDFRQTRNNDYVVLLHGLGRSSLSMKRMQAMLKKQEFQVINVSYPSRKYSVEKLAAIVKQKVNQCCSDPRHKVHFVTHSLGGILVRYMFQHDQLANMGRVVMLAPPNKGSELTDHLKDSFFYRKVTGPAGQQLGTKIDSIPNQLSTAVDYEVGVIIGNHSLNPYYSTIIPGADDGKVSVKRAKFDGMTDFLVVPHTHTFIMNSSKVIEQVVHFIDKGKFKQQKSKN